jgi:hypothetical protein
LRNDMKTAHNKPIQLTPKSGAAGIDGPAVRHSAADFVGRKVKSW